MGLQQLPPSWLSSWAPLSLFQIQDKTENYFWRTRSLLALVTFELEPHIVTSKQVGSFICSWSAFAAQGDWYPTLGPLHLQATHRHRTEAGEQTWPLGRAHPSYPAPCNTGALGQEAEGRGEGYQVTLCVWHADTGYSHGSGPSRLSRQSPMAL